MIKFSKHSWHRRIVDWGMGKDYLAYPDYKFKSTKGNKTHERFWEDKPINLCPYMRALAVCVLLSPWIGFWKILPEYCRIWHQDATKGFLILGSLGAFIHVFGTLQLGFEWWWVPLGISFISMLALVLLGIILGSMALSDWIRGRPKSEKTGLIREYMKAKHDKVCPSIEFDEEVKA